MQEKRSQYLQLNHENYQHKTINISLEVQRILRSVSLKTLSMLVLIFHYSEREYDFNICVI